MPAVVCDGAWPGKHTAAHETPGMSLLSSGRHKPRVRAAAPAADGTLEICTRSRCTGPTADGTLEICTRSRCTTRPDDERIHPPLLYYDLLPTVDGT